MLKIADAALTICPSCGKSEYLKQLSAAGFQLKGSGWYATDFKGDKKPANTTDKTEKSDKADKTEATPAPTVTTPPVTPPTTV